MHDNLNLDVAADRAFVLDDVKLEATGKLSTTTDNLDLPGHMFRVIGWDRGPLETPYETADAADRAGRTI